MKITRFETFLVSYTFPEEHSWWGGAGWDRDAKGVRFNGVILRVHTDEGITGLGEAGPWGDCRAIEARLHELEARFVGRDPFDVDKLTALSGDGWLNACLAPIDCALWDIVGKATETPVYRLLARDGDFQPKQIRTYASGGVGYNWFAKPDQVIEEVLQHKANGFTAFKMRIGSAWGLANMTPRRFGEHLARVRAAMGDDMDLMLDANCRFRSVDEALEICRILEDLGARWFEEPIPWRQPDGVELYNQIRANTTVPISGGEGIHEMDVYHRFAQAQAFDIVQPDASFIGMTNAYRVALMYHRIGRPCIPHSWTNAIAHAANAHLVAAIPNRVMLETQQIFNPMLTELVDNPIPVDKGFIDVSDRPGLGIELNEDVLKKYPFDENGIFVPWTH
ncbi:MAG: mandelate racemase/muconate lactonizing enzyme family protein [Chloroflexi bacterium]|nr:mandelate racemase/muconate lactonizing enzyme family protein [Chloroflexota bacterium]